MVRHKLLRMVLTAAPLMLAVPVAAHHGGASFDVGKEVTLKGTVTEWVWSNPHCFLKFDVKDESGAVAHWVVETQNPTTMTQGGWSRRMFTPGDQVTVTLQPYKNGAPIGLVRSVILPNGRKLGAGGGGAPVRPPEP
jgi:Family of unknown function (DUF6152)